MAVWEWRLNTPALLSYEDISGGEGPLGVAYTQNVDTRWDDVVPGPLLTTVDCSGADAAGGGSAGTAATTRSLVSSGGIDSTKKVVIARGTKLAAVRLDTRAQVLDGTMEGAGAPYGEAVTQVFTSVTAGGVTEISVLFDNTAYRVITALPNTGGFTATANNESKKIRHMFLGGSDGSAAVIAGLGRDGSSVMNTVYSNTLSGSTTMDASSWQTRATISGEAVTFTGGALDGRFWLIATSNGLYFLDSEGQRFRPEQEELPNDPNNDQGYGTQSISYLGPGVLNPTVYGLRLHRGGQSLSVGPETYRFNGSPIQGRAGWAGATARWIYLPIYNPVEGDSYICAVRPRQPGDPHNEVLSYYPIAHLDGKESKVALSTGFEGGQTRETIWVGSGTDVAWFEEGRTNRFPDDTGYTYAASGTLFSTKLRRAPGRKKRVQAIELTTAGCTSSNTIAVDVVYTDHTGTERTVRFGGTIKSNGLKRLEPPPSRLFEAEEFYLKLTFTRGGASTTAPKVKYGAVRVIGEVV